MAEPKAQLVDPQENMNLPGMNATGVITASSFSGEGGVVTGLTGSPNLNVGVVTATSFVGDGTGHAANLTGTPNLNLGLTTATSFIGDATGKAAGLTGTPNLNVGLVTATSFAGAVTGDVTGNITGLAGSVTPGVNLNVGVATGIQWHGDGSNLTGAGSSAYIAQEVTATGGETIIDLSYGNVIYYKGDANTTVGFASTSPAEQITIIRDTDPNYSISLSTGGVTFDGDDYLSMSDSNDFDLGSDNFTFEAWIKSGNAADSAIINQGDGNLGSSVTDTAWIMQMNASGYLQFWWSTNGTAYASYAQSTESTGGIISDDIWHHVAAVRNGSELYLFVDGVKQLIGNDEGSNQEYANISGSLYSSTRSVEIGIADSQYPMTGIISNMRIIKGTALYTTTFVPPTAALTNVTNTKLLCCQSDSSATAATVIPTGSITASGDPTAGAQTITKSGSLSATITWPSTVKWNNDTTPTLISNVRDSAFQIFHLTTGDTGASYQAWEEMKTDSETFGLYGAGATGYGALGINVSSGGYYSSPVQIPGTSWSSLIDTAWTSGVGGAIKSDGSMWVWGKTNVGILGLNVAGAGLGDSVSSPIQLGTETTWDNACFGGNNSEGCMAVKTDNTLWAWGANDYGILGLNEQGGAPTYPTSRSSPTQVGTDTTWKYVNYGGEDIILAIKTNGTLWRWGGNPKGAGGDNLPGTSPALRSSPVQVGTDTTWAYASNCRNGTSISTKTNGTLWCWGDNSKGQCGQNTNSSPSYSGLSSPTQVGSGTDWNYDNGSKIVAGYQRVFAIKTDGTLWTWGAGGPGSLMLNDRTDLSSPTQVPGIWKSGERGIRAGSPKFALKVE